MGEGVRILRGAFEELRRPAGSESVPPVAQGVALLGFSGPVTDADDADDVDDVDDPPGKGEETMCTMIAMTASVTGTGKGANGWFPITRATVGYDHGAHSGTEHAVLIDFTNYDLGVDARVAVELDLESGRALLAQLQSAIEAAEASGVALAREVRRAGEV
jgi:hypothetical protein